MNPFRLSPALPAGSYQTYAWSAPRDTQVRAACEDAGCLAWRRGWKSTFDESTELGKRQANYVRGQSGRTFRERRTVAGLTVFEFEAGQRCFADHQTRPAVWCVRGGDWRQNRGLVRRHVRGEDWVEDFAEHQQRLADQIEKG